VIQPAPGYKRLKKLQNNASSIGQITPHWLQIWSTSKHVSTRSKNDGLVFANRDTRDWGKKMVDSWHSPLNRSSEESDLRSLRKCSQIAVVKRCSQPIVYLHPVELFIVLEEFSVISMISSERWKERAAKRDAIRKAEIGINHTINRAKNELRARASQSKKPRFTIHELEAKPL